jgi:hypothetical protein
MGRLGPHSSCGSVAAHQCTHAILRSTHPVSCSLCSAELFVRLPSTIDRDLAVINMNNEAF